MSETKSIAINELTNLVKRHSTGTIDALSKEFPDFASDLKGGIALGKSDAAADQAFAEKKAKLAIRLANEVITVVTKRVEELKKTLATQRTRKIVLLSAGGLSGAATLAAIGFSPEMAARIGAVVTSLVSVGNTIHEFLLRGAERNLEAAITKMSEAIFSLTVLSQELEAAVQSHIGRDRIEALVNKANRIAEDLNGTAAVLGI